MTYVFSNFLYEDEAKSLDRVFDSLSWKPDLAERARLNALEMITAVRRTKGHTSELESFLNAFPLNSEAGLAMMCLAEALLRIPDHKTANALIRDKIVAAEWLQGKELVGGNWATKLAGFGLKVSSKTLDSFIGKLGEPVIREAMVHSLQLMARQFVFGETISDAFSHSKEYEKKGYRISYDMLGEGARDTQTAESYLKSYLDAIDYLGADTKKNGFSRIPSISVKLSALHPRYKPAQAERCIPIMAERLLLISQRAAREGLSLTIDAEEASRLDLSINLFEKIITSPLLKDWEGFGLAVQAYQKRALPLLDHIIDLAYQNKRKFHVRVVKGAYWDTEIKIAQVEGLPDYPVYTRKCNTDASYLACVHKLFLNNDHIYPMLATHNAHTVSAILEMSKEKNATFELQRLHGMGERLYDYILQNGLARASIYAPVGKYRELLPYLVRRLLENGANSSFVNQMLNRTIDIESMVLDPIESAKLNKSKRHPLIPLPEDIYNNLGNQSRRNSLGLDLGHPQSAIKTLEYVSNFHKRLESFSLVGGKKFSSTFSTDESVSKSFMEAKKAFNTWSKLDVDKRALLLESFADLLELHRDEFIAICVKEAGKTIFDSVAEVREAVDFCRYYAVRAREDFASEGLELVGYTGESNRLFLEGRGVFVCISPWNFPLAIFIGQIMAALVSGNCVICKPAEQTPFVAMRAVELMYKAGFPSNVIQMLIGDGDIGAKLVRHPDVSGVVFTGSVEVAKSIQLSLAMKKGPIVPFIAETGGQNVMIVDSSALLEQVVDDVLQSAFGSAGQRCSALRVLYVQDEIFSDFSFLLKGAMAELNIGDPKFLSTDIGPVIDENALLKLINHKEYLDKVGSLIAAVPMNLELANNGYFFAPCAYEIAEISLLKEEIFGPILHVIRYKAQEADGLLEKIHSTGYGLTFGVHTRIMSYQKDFARNIRAGNVYVNRSMIGAVVGVQPFGGMGLSGTGPKAGGPFYLHRFANEKVISVNTTASGGNTSLAFLQEGD